MRIRTSERNNPTCRSSFVLWDLIHSSPGYKYLRRITDLFLGGQDELWLRVVMNRETRKLIEQLRPAELKVLKISGHEWGKLEISREYSAAGYSKVYSQKASMQSLRFAAASLQAAFAMRR